MGAGVQLLWGEDEFGIAQYLAKLEAGFGSATETMLNVTHMDGRSLSVDEFRGVVYALPLFASKRLVVINQAAARFQSQPLRKQFLDVLAGMPLCTELVFVEPQKFDEGHWLVKWVKEHGSQEGVKDFGLIKGLAMEKWIQDQVKQAGGKIAAHAATLLASLVVDDTRLAYQEVMKLLTYVNYMRPIDIEDVEAMSVSVAQGNVFAMVDAVGNQDGRKASAILHQLLDERDALSLLQMVVRQFRMILVARELMDNGGRLSDLLGYFHVPNFVAEKVWAQARQFSMERIVQLFHKLVDLDDMIKMGEIEDSLALETFVVELTYSKEKEYH